MVGGEGIIRRDDFDDRRRGDEEIEEGERVRRKRGLGGVNRLMN